MIRRTPFYERLATFDQTGLWTHWAGHLVSVKYQMSVKAEYFAVRNSAGIIDTSPLYRYRITGRDAERFLAGVLARDVRTCADGQAQYTVWCDDRGHVVEDGVVFRHARDEFVLTSAEPNLAYFQDLVGHDAVEIVDESARFGSLAVQGPRSRQILAAVAPSIAELAYFQHAPVRFGGTDVLVSRTGYTGDLGYEIWVEAGDANAVWDTLAAASDGHGAIPVGQSALLMLRIEAGLLLIDADFHSSRFAFVDEDRSSPFELGLGWMLGDLATTDRAFIGRDALRRERAERSSRWTTVGLVVDWHDWDRRYGEAGLIPPKDVEPVLGQMMLYDDGGERVGYTTSFMYSPVLQRHIAMARVLPHLAAVGRGTAGPRVHLEVTINHRYQTVAADVARPPLFAPQRKTA